MWELHYANTKQRFQITYVVCFLITTNSSLSTKYPLHTRASWRWLAAGNWSYMTGMPSSINAAAKTHDKALIQARNKAHKTPVAPPIQPPSHQTDSPPFRQQVSMDKSIVTWLPENTLWNSDWLIWHRRFVGAANYTRSPRCKRNIFTPRFHSSTRSPAQRQPTDRR